MVASPSGSGASQQRWSLVVLVPEPSIMRSTGVSSSSSSQPARGGPRPAARRGSSTANSIIVVDPVIADRSMQTGGEAGCPGPHRRAEVRPISSSSMPAPNTRAARSRTTSDGCVPALRPTRRRRRLSLSGTWSRALGAASDRGRPQRRSRCLLLRFHASADQPGGRTGAGGLRPAPAPVRFPMATTRVQWARARSSSSRRNDCPGLARCARRGDAHTTSRSRLGWWCQPETRSGALPRPPPPPPELRHSVW